MCTSETTQRYTLGLLRLGLSDFTVPMGSDVDPSVPFHKNVSVSAMLVRCVNYSCFISLNTSQGKTPDSVTFFSHSSGYSWLIPFH